MGFSGMKKSVLLVLAVVAGAIVTLNFDPLSQFYLQTTAKQDEGPIQKVSFQVRKQNPPKVQEEMDIQYDLDGLKQDVDQIKSYKKR